MRLCFISIILPKKFRWFRRGRWFPFDLFVNRRTHKSIEWIRSVAMWRWFGCLHETDSLSLRASSGRIVDGYMLCAHIISENRCVYISNWRQAVFPFFSLHLFFFVRCCCFIWLVVVLRSRYRLSTTFVWTFSFAVKQRTVISRSVCSNIIK